MQHIHLLSKPPGFCTIPRSGRCSQPPLSGSRARGPRPHPTCSHMDGATMGATHRTHRDLRSSRWCRPPTPCARNRPLSDSRSYGASVLASARGAPNEKRTPLTTHAAPPVAHAARVGTRLGGVQRLLTQRCRQRCSIDWGRGCGGPCLVGPPSRSHYSTARPPPAARLQLHAAPRRHSAPRCLAPHRYPRAEHTVRALATGCTGLARRVTGGRQPRANSRSWPTPVAWMSLGCSQRPAATRRDA